MSIWISDVIHDIVDYLGCRKAGCIWLYRALIPAAVSRGPITRRWSRFKSSGLPLRHYTITYVPHTRQPRLAHITQCIWPMLVQCWTNIDCMCRVSCDKRCIVRRWASVDNDVVFKFVGSSHRSCPIIINANVVVDQNHAMETKIICITLLIPKNETYPAKLTWDERPTLHHCWDSAGDAGLVLKQFLSNVLRNTDDLESCRCVELRCLL